MTSKRLQCVILMMTFLFTWSVESHAKAGMVQALVRVITGGRTAVRATGLVSPARVSTPAMLALTPGYVEVEVSKAVGFAEKCAPRIYGVTPSDAVQELALGVCAGTWIEQYAEKIETGDCALSGYLIGCLRNRLRPEQTWRTRHVPLDATVLTEEQRANLGRALFGHDLTLEKEIFLKEVRTFWNELPAEERQLLVLRYDQDKTPETIARELHLSPSTVYRRLNTTYECLRKMINRESMFTPDNAAFSLSANLGFSWQQAA